MNNCPSLTHQDPYTTHVIKYKALMRARTHAQQYYPESGTGIWNRAANCNLLCGLGPQLNPTV